MILAWPLRIRALRVHTPHVPCWLHVSAASCNFGHVNDHYLHIRKRPVVHMSRRLLHISSGHGWGVWLRWPTKYTICDTCRLCHSIDSGKASFSPNLTDLLCLQVAKVPRCRDLVTFFVDNHNDNSDRTDYFTPCTRPQGKYSNICTRSVADAGFLERGFCYSSEHEHKETYWPIHLCLKPHR